MAKRKPGVEPPHGPDGLWYVELEHPPSARRAPWWQFWRRG